MLVTMPSALAVVGAGIEGERAADETDENEDDDDDDEDEEEEEEEVVVVVVVMAWVEVGASSHGPDWGAVRSMACEAWNWRQSRNGAPRAC